MMNAHCSYQIMSPTKLVTKKSILLTYQLLRSMVPFCDWRLPTKIQTKVVHDPTMFGCFDEPAIITISTAIVWDFKQLTSTVAHEMIHVYQAKLKLLNDQNHHDEFFYECAYDVCMNLGFDKESF